MVEDLFTSILGFIYTIWYITTEKIIVWIKSVSGVTLSRTIVDIAGLLVILMIFLAIAILVNKAIRLRRKESATQKTLESDIEKKESIETNPEQHIEKKETNGATPGPLIQQQPASEPIPEQQVEKRATNKVIPEHKRYHETFVPSGIMIPDGNNIEHLLNELHKIDMIIRLDLEKWKKEHSKDTDDFMGLYISENEVNAMLQVAPHELNAEAGSIEEKIQIIFREINISLETEKSLRLHSLQELFQLDAFEVNALLICLASELDMRYEKMYSYLHNDVTKKRPTVDLVINLLCSSIEKKLKAREYFSTTSALIKNHIIYLTGDGLEGQNPLLSRSIKVDERIIIYLLGENKIDQTIMNFSYLLKPERTFDALILDDKKMLEELIKHRSINPMFFFHGAYGTGKKLTAEAICKYLNIPLLVVDSKVLMKGDSLEVLKIIIREARLQQSSLYLEGFDALLERETAVDVTGLILELDHFQGMVFLSGELPWTSIAILKNHTFVDMAFSIPSFATRKILFESLLRENISKEKLPDDLDIDVLASKFNFSGGQIKDAIFTAISLGRVRKPDIYEISMDDLYRGCKIQSNKNLSSFAKNVLPRCTWDDIVLPKDVKEQLKEVSGYIIHRGKVYDEWGFDTKLSLGKGLNVLFSGPSGAGKTMAAEVIAKEASLDIYKIDLSTVVSKYIGETEKILKKIFNEAETGNAILFFDEADALFGKRSEVKDSHDRYANIEINYLLQKMEEHEGIVILASNFKSNIDDAFLRRMHLAIEFPFPDEELRKKIWKDIFPLGTPVSTMLFHISDIKDPINLRARLQDRIDPLSAYLQRQFSLPIQEISEKSDSKRDDIFKENLVSELNRLIKGPSIFEEQRFEHVALTEKTRMLVKQNLQGEELIRLNRLLLAEAYPDEITKGIDFDFLAKFKITGGNIKNIALSAAFLAASESSIVKMKHIIKATKREFQKMRKPCTPEDFGEYYELVK